MADWISVIEAGYALDRDPMVWMEGVLEACGPVLGGEGAALAACQFRRREDGFEIEQVVTRPAGPARSAIQKLLGAGAARVPGELMFRGSDFACLSAQVPERADQVEQAFRKLSRGRFADGVGGIAHSGDGRALALGAGLPKRGTADRELRAAWVRVASHLGAGLRLLYGLSPARDEEAVFEPGGKLCHARGHARCDSAREVLRDAVRRIDGARTRAGRGDPESALSSWQGLISGRWSLVDRFEADGRRYVVALRNDPEVARPPGLSRREAQVAEYLALGHSEKEIAYTLGLSQSAISRRVSSAVQKLGLRSRAELAALASAFASGVAFREVELAGARLAIGSAPSSAPPAELSPAERQIAALASRGRSDAEIASERGASRRTVENQLHHIYRKLGVHSRAELAARLSA